MKKMLLGLLAGAALLGASINANANLIQNGSFEDPVIAGDWQNFGYPVQDASSIPNWTAYNVDLVKNTYFRAADGNQSLDLNGWDSGTILQTFQTTPGQKYRLSFELAGNPLGSGPSLKVVDVKTGTVSVSDTFNVAGHNPNNMGYITLSYDFVAGGAQQTLEFLSGSSGTGGAVLDNVQVNPVPEPGSMMLLGAGFLGLAIYGKRRKNA